MTDVVPTQADREAYITFNNLPGVHLAEVRAGKWDNTTGMQIIARHAATARLEVAVAVREAIASGYPEPAAKADKCEHDLFGWEGCIGCYDDFLEATLERALAGENKL